MLRCFVWDSLPPPSWPCAGDDPPALTSRALECAIMLAHCVLVTVLMHIGIYFSLPSFLSFFSLVMDDLETGFLCIALAFLELRNPPGTRLASNSEIPPASASQVLGLQACATTAWLNFKLLILLPPPPSVRCGWNMYPHSQLFICFLVFVSFIVCACASVGHSKYVDVKGQCLVRWFTWVWD